MEHAPQPVLVTHLQWFKEQAVGAQITFQRPNLQLALAASPAQATRTRIAETNLRVFLDMLHWGRHHLALKEQHQAVPQAARQTHLRRLTHPQLMLTKR